MSDSHYSAVDPVDVLRAGVSFERLLLVGTGALSVSFLPYWTNWISAVMPNVSVKIALTRAARKFVSDHALAALSRTDVFVDEWPESPVREAPHVQLAAWPDVVVVHPATVHFVSRLALGLADTPVLLALQTTRAVVGVAPAFPPGALENPVLTAHLDALIRRPRFVVAPTEPAVSASTGELEEGGAAPLSDVVGLVEARYRELGAEIRA